MTLVITDTLISVLTYLLTYEGRTIVYSERECRSLKIANAAVSVKKCDQLVINSNLRPILHFF